MHTKIIPHVENHRLYGYGLGYSTTVSDYNVKYINKIQDIEFKCQGIQLKY